MYNSVPTQLSGIPLEKLGVPDLVIDIIWSFHEDTKAKMCISGELQAVENGLRQRHTLAPVFIV